MSTSLPVQTQPYQLSGSGSSIGDTVLNLKAFKDILGVNLTMTQFGGSTGYGTLEPGNNAQEEQISFSGVTQNSDGTAQLTGVKHVLFITPFTETSGMTITHAGSVTFVISNTSAWENTIYTYANSLASGGTPASQAQIGITKLTQDPTILASPIAVGANTSYSGTAISTSNKAIDAGAISTTAATGSFGGAIVQTNASGRIDSSFFPNLFSVGGNGSDGALTITSGITTINLGGLSSVSKNYTSISITGTGQLAFSNPGPNGTYIILKSQGAVTITSSTSPNIDTRGMGAPGSTSGFSAVGIVAASTNAGNPNPYTPGAVGAALSPTIATSSSMPIFVPFVVGAGGSGATGTGSGTGGASGAGGGALLIDSGGALNFTGSINSSGIVGSNASGGTLGNSAGGGGGGGAGSTVILFVSVTASSGTITTAGGTGGAASNGSTGTGGGGGAGGSSYSVGLAGIGGLNNNTGTSGAGSVGGAAFSLVTLNNTYL